MSIKINIENPIDARIKLKARKTLDGNIMIFDHEEMDIVLMPTKSKIVTFAKNDFSETVYSAQNRLFAHLRKKGLIIPESIQGGSFYGSFEATMEQASSEELSTPKMSLINISKFIDEERPYFESTEAIVSITDDELSHPDKEDSTELGEVPQRAQQGSIRKGYVRDPYSLNYLYTFE